MANIIINGGTITQTATSGNTGQKSIVLKTKDTYVLEDIQVDVSATATEGTFANTLPSGDSESSYPSNTSQQTVIPANGSLYLSGGWYSKQKIELGHLIPEIADKDAAGVKHILYGYSAFTDDGTQITGTMPTITPTFDGGVVSTTASLNYTAPSGTIVAKGSLIPGTSQGELGDNYGVTTTQPSTGTEGSDFLTIEANLNVIGNGSVTAKSTATRTAVLYNGNAVGYVDKNDDTVALDAPSQNVTDTSTQQIIDLDNVVTDNFSKLYIPIVTKIKTDGGGVTKSSDTNNVTCTVTDIELSSTGRFTEVGDGGTGANYGVHKITSGTVSAEPTGTDGVDYLKIQTGCTGGVATVSGTVTVNYSRGAVSPKNVYKGLVSLDTNQVLNTATEGSLIADVSKTATADITGDDSYYYIDIVNPKGSAPTITPTGISDTLAFSNGNPSVNSYITGTILPGTGQNNLGDEYGVTTTTPTGTDGESYLTISQGATATTKTLSGDTTITYTRGAVNSNAVYKGAVSMTKDTELVPRATGQSITYNLSKEITPTATHSADLYIPITTAILSGGTLGSGTITITPSGSNTSGVTPSISLVPSQGTENESDFGVQTTVPNGYYIVLDPNASVDDVTINASIDVTRSSVTVSGSRGLWNGTGDSISQTSKTYTGTETIEIPVNAGTSKYIPVVVVDCEANCEVTTNPTVTTTTSAQKKVQNSSPTTAPAGVVTSTNAPSDLTTYSAGYIIVSPGSSSSTAGVATATATGFIGKGITKGGTYEAEEVTANVTTTVNNNSGAKTYIKIYDGGYDIEDL